MKRLKVFIFNTLILMASSLLFRIISVVFGVYISNKIGQEAMGIFQLIMSVYMFGITLATSGLNLASTRIVSEELAKNNETGAKIACKKCIFISLICGIIACIILVIFADFIVHFCLHDKVDKKIIYLIGIALPFISMSSAINGYFTAVRKAYKTASRTIY